MLFSHAPGVALRFQLDVDYVEAAESFRSNASAQSASLGRRPASAHDTFWSERRNHPRRAEKNILTTTTRAFCAVDRWGNLSCFMLERVLSEVNRNPAGELWSFIMMSEWIHVAHNHSLEPRALLWGECGEVRRGAELLACHEYFALLLDFGIIILDLMTRFVHTHEVSSF